MEFYRLTNNELDTPSYDSQCPDYNQVEWLKNFLNFKIGDAPDSWKMHSDFKNLYEHKHIKHFDYFISEFDSPATGLNTPGMGDVVTPDSSGNPGSGDTWNPPLIKKKRKKILYTKC